MTITTNKALLALAMGLALEACHRERQVEESKPVESEDSETPPEEGQQ